MSVVPTVDTSVVEMAVIMAERMGTMWADRSVALSVGPWVAYWAS